AFVQAEDARKNVGGFLRAERLRRIGGHRRLDPIEQVAEGQRAPRVKRFAADEARAVLAAGEVRVVAFRAAAAGDRFAALRLLRAVHAAPDRRTGCGRRRTLRTACQQRVEAEER